jgi:hypothetical protein
MAKIETYLNKDGLTSIFSEIAKQMCKELGKEYNNIELQPYLRDLATISLFGFENAKLNQDIEVYRSFENYNGLSNNQDTDQIIQDVTKAIWDKLTCNL